MAQAAVALEALVAVGTWAGSELGSFLDLLYGEGVGPLRSGHGTWAACPVHVSNI